MRNLKHQLIKYSDNSGYDNSVDPSTKNYFDSGENVVICRDKNSLISLRSLKANDYQCPFCLNKLNPDLATVGVAKTYGEDGEKLHPSPDSQPRPSRSDTAIVLWGVFVGVMLLCLVIATVELFATLGNSGDTSDLAPINTSTLPQIPSTTPQLSTVQATIEVIQIPSPPSTKTSQPNTVPSTSDPEEFARQYFMAVWKDRDYEYLWDRYLTENFQNHSSPGGLQDYVNWWSSVKQVDIHSVEAIQNDGKNAWIRVIVTFHLNDGRILSNRQYDYDLIYNSDLNTWMFDYHN